nr:hypothetical protein [Tanacetum cinerariifolium]
MASEQSSSGPVLNEMTPGTISLGLVQKSSPSTSYVPPSRNDWDLLFQPMFDELLNPPPSVVNQAPKVIAPIAEVIPPVHANLTGSPSSTTVDQMHILRVNLIQQQKYNPRIIIITFFTIIVIIIIITNFISGIPRDFFLRLISGYIENPWLLLVASFSCCAFVMATSERTDRLLALEALAACLPFSEVAVNEQLKAEVLTRSSHSSKTSYAVDADLSEVELKKILIEKIEGNKSIQRSYEQRNLYKALVEAYESDKIILDTYGETYYAIATGAVPPKPEASARRTRSSSDTSITPPTTAASPRLTTSARTNKQPKHDDADKDEEPSAGPNRGSKRRKEGMEPESASAPTKTATRSAGRSTQGSRSRQALVSESALAEEPMQTTSQMEEPSHPEFDTGAEDQPIVQSSQHPEWFSQQHKPPSLDRSWNKTVPAVHGSIQPWISDLAKQADTRSSFNKLMDTPMDFSNFLINRLKVNPEGQQYPHNLLKPLPLIPNNRGRRVIPFEYFINNNLEYLRGGDSSRKYTTSIMKMKAADYEHIKWIEDLVPQTIWIEEPIAYDKHALWGVSHWGRKQWHSYKHLDWITVRRDNDKLYKFNEGDFKRLRIQDIEDTLLLLVQGKLTILTVEERFAFNVSLRMFTRSIVIQRRVQDLQLGVESYQKKLNLTKLDLY